MKYFVANLKANMTFEDIVTYVPLLEDISKPGVIICPTNIFVPYFLGNTYTVGVQDISMFSKGSYTGEVSSEQLTNMGIEYVIIGHSERRKYQNETDDMIRDKIKKSLSCHLKVILCIGEEEGANKEGVLKEQLQVLEDIDLENIIVAYEPIWAIGSGKVPTNEEISESVEYIKDWVEKQYRGNVDVLYGGSVTSVNLPLLKEIDCLDGVLVGKASTDSEQLLKMIEIF